MKNKCYKCKSRGKCKKYKEENRMDLDDLLFTILMGVLLAFMPLSLVFIPLMLVLSN